MIPTELRRVETLDDWRAYHHIRRLVLFEARGRFGLYDEQHPDERMENNHPLLFLVQDEGIGAARLDNALDGSAHVRLVAVTATRQRQGLGRALMTALEAYARRLRVKRLRANVAPDAIGFYAKVGWSMQDKTLENPLMTKRLA